MEEKKKQLKKNLDFATLLWVEAFSNTKRTKLEHEVARKNMDRIESEYFEFLIKEKL